MTIHNKQSQRNKQIIKNRSDSIQGNSKNPVTSNNHSQANQGKNILTSTKSKDIKLNGEAINQKSKLKTAGKIALYN